MYKAVGIPPRQGCFLDRFQQLIEMVNRENGSQLQWQFLDNKYLFASYWVDDKTSDVDETTSTE